MNLKLLAFLLTVLSLRFYFSHQNQIELGNGQKIDFETTVLSAPQAVGSQQAFTANYENTQIKIVTGRFPEINYGDFIHISGAISNKNGRVLMYFPKIKAVERSSSFLQGGLKNINIFRKRLILLFSRTLPSPSSSLLLGIIFGIKEQVPKDFTENLRTTGVFHVIAASGMNVALVSGFISSGFAFFFKRQIAIGLSILGIMFYAILAGLEPSIIRASIMGILVFSAQIIGRQVLAVNSLLLAGFGMLLIDPLLISDIGFQLSFAATFGILYIQPAFGKKERFTAEFLTTISAQIATLPILLANFGVYSIYSILVNGLVLWTIPIMMAFGGLGAIFGLILMPLGQVLIYLCYPLLLYFEAIVNIFGKMGGILVVGSLPWQFIVGYYCLLASILVFSKREQ